MCGDHGQTVVYTQKPAPPLNVFTKFGIEINMVMIKFYRTLQTKNQHKEDVNLVDTLRMPTCLRATGEVISLLYFYVTICVTDSQFRLNGQSQQIKLSQEY